MTLALPHCAVASTWGGRGVKLAHGERPDGTIVPIADVVSGLACDCLCPGCGAKLIARKGEVTEHHFAHFNASDCAHALESALHKLAKQLLDKERRLKLPSVRAEIGDQVLELHAARVHRFDEAILEHRLGNVVPDVIVLKKGQRLLVEMYVTHRCDAEKIAKIQELGLSCVEIDLRRLPRDASDAQVIEALMDTARRYWIHNPRLAVAEEQLLETIAQRETAARDAAAKAAERHRRGLETLATRSAAIWNRPTKPTTAPSEAEEAVRAFRMSSAIGLGVGGQGAFAWTEAQWQARLLVDYIFPLANKGSYSSDSLSGTDAIKLLSALDTFKPQQKTYFTLEEEAFLKERIEGFQSPYATVVAYLDRLSELGILVRNRSRWTIKQSFFSIWAERRRRKVARSEDAEAIQQLLAAILRHIPLGERTGFVIARYWEETLPVFGRSIADMLEADDAQVGDLIRGLTRVEGMLAQAGDIVEELYGLPAQLARERCIDSAERREIEAELQKRERAQEDARERISSLDDAARIGLGEEAEAWLATVQPELGDQSPRMLAAASAEGLDRAKVGLRHAQAVLADSIAAKRWQHELLAFAATTAKPDLALTLLRNPHPHWGNRRPIDTCLDEPSFKKLKENIVSFIRRGTF